MLMVPSTNTVGDDVEASTNLGSATAELRPQRTLVVDGKVNRFGNSGEAAADCDAGQDSVPLTPSCDLVVELTIVLCCCRVTSPTTMFVCRRSSAVESISFVDGRRPLERLTRQASQP